MSYFTFHYENSFSPLTQADCEGFQSAMVLLIFLIKNMFCVAYQCMMPLVRWVVTLKEVTPTSLVCCSSVALPTVQLSLESTARSSLGRYKQANKNI